MKTRTITLLTLGGIIFLLVTMALAPPVSADNTKTYKMIFYIQYNLSSSELFGTAGSPNQTVSLTPTNLVMTLNELNPETGEFGISADPWQMYSVSADITATMKRWEEGGSTDVTSVTIPAGSSFNLGKTFYGSKALNLGSKDASVSFVSYGDANKDGYYFYFESTGGGSLLLSDGTNKPNTGWSLSSQHKTLTADVTKAVPELPTGIAAIPLIGFLGWGMLWFRMRKLAKK